ncbi:MAG: ROK family protein [Kouleothrix sp.]|nr:ROK family protein [Kouleothrix sp.]
MAEAADPGCVIALDVGGTSIKSGVVCGGSVLGAPRQTALQEAGPARAILAVFGQVLWLHLRELGDRRLAGVALGFPAPFDYPRGVCLLRHKFAALYGRDMRKALRAFLPDASVPVLFRNDAEAAIVGEARYGVGRRYRRLVGLTLGTGLGSAFLEAGRPVTDRADLPPRGELYAVPFHGTPADELFSIRGLTARLRAATPALNEIKPAADLARAGDPAARAAFAQFGADLGELLAPFARTFDAEAVLLLGGIANAADLFADAMRGRLAADVVAGELGPRAALLGAAALLLDDRATSRSSAASPG